MKNYMTRAAGSGAHLDGPVTGMDRQVPPSVGPEKTQHPSGHRLLMMAMCLPMLVIVGVLVTAGVAGGGALVYALLCTAMMAAMMVLMPGNRH